MLAFPARSENLLVGLSDIHRHFLGIGVIRAIDYAKNVAKIQTSVEEKPAVIILGKVRLDNYLHEISDEVT